MIHKTRRGVLDYTRRLVDRESTVVVRAPAFADLYTLALTDTLNHDVVVGRMQQV